MTQKSCCLLVQVVLNLSIENYPWLKINVAKFMN